MTLQLPARFRRDRGKHVPPPPLAREAKPDDLSSVRAHENLIVSEDGVTAWFVLGDVDWQYRGVDEREEILSAQAARWADLSGLRVTLRLTSAPFNRASWVARLGRDYPVEPAPGQKFVSKRLPDREGAWSFDQVLAGAQAEMIDLGARSSAVLLGVHLTPQVMSKTDLRKLYSPTPLVNQDAGLDEVRRSLRHITGVVAKVGMGGRPITRNALGWLIHASVGLGLPVPPVLLSGKRSEWEPDDIPGFTSGVAVTAEPYAASVTVHAVRGGVEQEAHVAVLHASRFEKRHDNGGLAAWLSWFQQLPYGVDVVAQFDLIDPKALKGSAESDRRRLDDQLDHYAEHGDTPPANIGRAQERASQVEDEVSTGGREQTRARGVVMVAVTGATEDDVLETANDLVSRANSEIGITLVHGLDQYHSARGFIPGEPIARTGLITQMPVDFLAAGVPNASAKCGDSTGWFVGPIAGGHDIFLLDPHGGSARNKSNLMVVGAAPGVAGKSSLGAALLDWGARCGEQSLGFDPAEQWQRLCDLPQHRNDSRHLDLFSARRGILNPFTLRPDPQVGDYESGEDFADAMVDARQERLDLMIDTASGLIPFGMVNGDVTGRVAGCIEQAVSDVGGDYGTDPWKVIDRLEHLGEIGKEIAQRLRTRAELKDGGLIFPDRDVVVDHSEITSATLTIITMKGLSLPPKDNPNRATWTRKQQQALPVLNLSTWLALSAMYAGMNPTNIHLDELNMLVGGAGGSFGPFMTRASVDSRKWNTNVGMYFQNPGMLTAVDPEISNLVGSAWIGHMNRDVAKKALPLLHLDEKSGADRVIASLEAGEWIVRDWMGRRRRVRVHRDGWCPQTFAAIDTNPGGEGMYETSSLAGIFDEDEF